MIKLGIVWSYTGVKILKFNGAKRSSKLCVPSELSLSINKENYTTVNPTYEVSHLDIIANILQNYFTILGFRSQLVVEWFWIRQSSMKFINFCVLLSVTNKLK